MQTHCCNLLGVQGVAANLEYMHAVALLLDNVQHAFATQCIERVTCQERVADNLPCALHYKVNPLETNGMHWSMAGRHAFIET